MILARTSLEASQRDEMFTLISRHFHGVTRPQFDADLAEKNWVIEVRKDTRLIGFSTLLVTSIEFDGSPVTVIYSGDTIVSPEGWGSPTLARNWIAGVNQLRSQTPRRPCYWLLLTSGFRTYRFLPVFWREFYPTFANPAPEKTQRLLDHLATAHYGPLYNPSTGLVRFPHPQQLAADSLPSGRVRDPHIAFFLEKNPRHAAGDELVCLTEICDSNLTAAGIRMVRPAAP